MTVKPRHSAPTLEIRLPDGTNWCLDDAKAATFQMIVFYRGLHCPICKAYLGELETKLPEFVKRGVGIIAVSVDSCDRAQRAKTEWGLNNLLVGSELTIAAARDWELFISTVVREGEPAEFSEPGLFLIRLDGTVFYASRTSAPWGRPSFDQILRGLNFVAERKTPARGKLKEAPNVQGRNIMDRAARPAFLENYSGTRSLPFKSWLLQAFATTMLCFAAMISASPTHAAERVFKFGAPFPSGSSLHKGMLKFKEVVEAESRGRIEIDLYPDSKLGDIAGLLSGLQDGSVDMALLGISTAADVKGGSALNIGALPFLYKDRKWVAKISNGPIYQKLFDDFAKVSNIRIFASYGERLPRAFETVRGPIRVPTDLKGMRIRVAPIDIYVETTKAFGAIPVRTDINVTYDLLKSGEIDGQENGIELAIPLKLYEVAKYWTEVDYAPSLATWYSTETVWKTLGPADQELLIKAAKAGGEVITELSKKQSSEGIEMLKAEGVIISQPDVDAFRKAAKDIYKRYEGKFWSEGLVTKIKALQEQPR